MVNDILICVISMGLLWSAIYGLLYIFFFRGTMDEQEIKLLRKKAGLDGNFNQNH